MTWRQRLRLKLWLAGALLKLAERIPLSFRTLPIRRRLGAWSDIFRRSAERDLDERDVADPWKLPKGHRKRIKWDWHVAAILEFVASVVDEDGTEVWLTGSRVRGDYRPDSDWDVVVFSQHAPRRPEDLFLANQLSRHKVDGGIIELVIAHPDHWDDPRRYMAELRASGVRLR